MRAFWVISAWLFVGAMCHAADPVASLLPLIPEDTAITFVVRNAGPQLQKLATSPMKAWLLDSPLGRQLADPKEADKLKGIIDFVVAQLGVTPDEIRDDILGDAIVFAYQMPKPGTTTDAGTILIRPRKPEVMQKLLDRVNTLQVAAKEILEPRSVAYKSTSYSLREKSDGSQEFFRLKDGIFVFTNRESTMHEILDQVNRPVTTLPRWLALDDGQSTAVALFRPRAFDASWVERRDASQNTGEKALLAHIGQLWKACEGVGLAVHADQDLHLKAMLDVEDTKLPAAWRELAKQPTPAPWPAGAIPDNAMLAVQGTMHLKSWLEIAAPFFPKEGEELRKLISDTVGPAVGQDRLPEVLNDLGPRWSFWLAAPPEGSAVPTAYLGVQMPEKLAPALRQGVDTLLHTVRLQYNRAYKEQLTITSGDTGASLKHPTGFTLSYTTDTTQNALIFRTHPSAKTQATSPTSASVLVRAPLLRQYLSTHKDAVMTWLAESSKRPPAEVSKELSDLINLLEATERLELTFDRRANKLEAHLRLQFVKPLAK
jgi:hypothetical protein